MRPRRRLPPPAPRALQERVPAGAGACWLGASLFVSSARAINLPVHLPPRGGGGGAGGAGRLGGRGEPAQERPRDRNPRSESPCVARTCSSLQQPPRVEKGLFRLHRGGRGGRLYWSVVEPPRGEGRSARASAPSGRSTRAGEGGERRAGGEEKGGESCGREAPRPRRRRRWQPERKFPGRARPREGWRGRHSRRGSRVPRKQSAFSLRALGRRAWLAGKQGGTAVGRPPTNLEGENAASGNGGAGRGGALSAPRGSPRTLLPGPRPGERAEAERAGRGSSAATAPALRTRAASATVPASPPRPGAMVRGARTPRAGL